MGPTKLGCSVACLITFFGFWALIMLPLSSILYCFLGFWALYYIAIKPKTYLSLYICKNNNTNNNNNNKNQIMYNIIHIYIYIYVSLPLSFCLSVAEQPRYLRLSICRGSAKVTRRLGSSWWGSRRTWTSQVQTLLGLDSM